MKKFIMILAALTMLGAAVVGVFNKNEVDALGRDLDEVRTDVSDVNEKLGEAKDNLDEAEESMGQAKDARDQASAAVEGVRQEVKRIERSLEEVGAELKKVEIEQKEIDLAVKQQFPDGEFESAEDLQMTLTMLEERLTEKQNRKSELNSQLASAKQAQQSVAAKVEEEEKYQRQRAQKLALNGLVATIIAVNKEWGFVMVNAGKQNGVQPNSSLLVKRGNSRVARLRMINLQNTVTVADVVEESTVAGIDIQPGDKVIFENTN